MLEARINCTEAKKEIFISQLNGGFEEIAKDLVIILDRIIADETIKISPMMMGLADKEKEKLIIKKRREVLSLMDNIPFSEQEYVYSDETSLYLSQKYGV